MQYSFCLLIIFLVKFAALNLWFSHAFLNKVGKFILAQTEYLVTTGQMIPAKAHIVFGGSPLYFYSFSSQV